MPQHTVRLPKRANNVLLKIIRNNFGSQYATTVASLSEFRNAVSTHGGTEDNATLLADFRVHVPLSDYDSYKPFIDKFESRPCKEEDVENLLSPGLPDFLVHTSATSGSKLKIYPKYNNDARLGIPTNPLFDPNNKDPLAALCFLGSRDVKEVERAGKGVQRISVYNIVGGYMRRGLGWYVDDERQMSLISSGYAVPWAATVIRHFPSFLTIHGLFFLARRDVYEFRIPFATQFVDLIHCINEHWELLVCCIRDGIIPDIEDIEHVRKYLQVHFHPNPERASELLKIGPPFSFEGWFAHVWPKADLSTVCTGQFSTVLPTVRSILGPSVSVRGLQYGASEAMMGVAHDSNKLDEYVLRCADAIEFLDVSLDATQENLCQAWEVEVGKHYEPILTTRDGLWRYRLGDVLHIVGFDNESPIFKYIRRRSLMIRFQFAQVTDDQLLSAIHAFSSEDTILVHEFTTVLDDRTLPRTLGFFIEPVGPLGPNVHLAPQKLFDALVSYNNELLDAFQIKKLRVPTIRIVKAGTFAECRRWKSEKVNTAFAQVKVPVVLLDSTMQEWISERVVQEL